MTSSSAALAPNPSQVHRQADQPHRGDHQADVGGHVVGHRADPAVHLALRVGGVPEHAAEDVEHDHRQRQGEDHRERLAGEQLELNPGRLGQRPYRSPPSRASGR
jgi:hypothetical protein